MERAVTRLQQPELGGGLRLGKSESMSSAFWGAHDGTDEVWGPGEESGSGAVVVGVAVRVDAGRAALGGGEWENGAAGGRGAGGEGEGKSGV